MRLRVENAYPADPETVAAMLWDEEFRRRVCVATHAIRYDVSVRQAPDTVTVRTTRLLPAEVPAAIRALVGETLEVIQTEDWPTPAQEGRRSAMVRVEIPGKPVRAEGRVDLEPHGGGTRHVLQGEITASVPLLGGRVERAAAEAIESALAKEAEIGRRWLAGDGH